MIEETGRGDLGGVGAAVFGEAVGAKQGTFGDGGCVLHGGGGKRQGHGGRAGQLPDCGAGGPAQ